MESMDYARLGRLSRLYAAGETTQDEKIELLTLLKSLPSTWTDKQSQIENLEKEIAA